MTLEPRQLAKLVQIIDGIYEGNAAPRVRGQVGQFLRACQTGRLDVQQVLTREGIASRSGGWTPGEAVGGIELELLADVQTHVPTDLWGPVEHAPTACEQLGFVVDLTLWTSARAANRAHVLLNSGSAALHLAGGYRWFAPGRVTPGDALVDGRDDGSPKWQELRFLKATAEDVGRPPHPLEYILDYRLGAPGLKSFRVFAGRIGETGFEVLPGVRVDVRRLTLLTDRAPQLHSLGRGDLAMVFAYREPWSESWHALEGQRATVEDCLAHSVAWADFRAEMDRRPRLTFGDVEQLRSALGAVGVKADDGAAALEAASLNRQLAPAAAALVRWFRYRR